MSGSKQGGVKAAKVNKSKYGDDFYRKIGKMGGSVSHPETRPFTTHKGLASRAGVLGGRKSRRGSFFLIEPEQPIVTHREPL